MTGGIIDPTRRSTVTATRSDAPRPESLAGLRVGLLENGKRNAAQILDAVGRVLAERHGTGPMVPKLKRQFAMPLPEELVEELVQECDVVVIGVGDCGSCSASAVADGIRLEQAGVPAAVVCTDAFEATSRAMAELKGDERYPFILTEHPVANLTHERIEDRAGQLAERVAERLLVRRPASEVA
ncbi:UGSC family (seleno)protein [Georgenia alba]|uniref:UGSC family (Seleno)protein n=1 Tax=Georgenia alba TaxID=2233858 RepID=A0ABW2Q5E4_9MICO